MEAERKRAVEQAGEVTGELRVRFPDVAVGKVVVGAVEVDAELRPDRCYRALQWEEHGELVVTWSGASVRFVRTAMVSFMEILAYTIKLAQDVQQIPQDRLLMEQ